MRNYIVRRFILALFTIWLVSVFTFGAVRLVPGDVVDQMGIQSAVEFKIAKDEIRRRMGLTQPIYRQYANWMGGVFHGDFGKSVWTQTSVLQRIKQRIPVSLELGILAMLFAVIMGLAVGILSAVRQDTILDYLGRSVAIGGLSMPDFWIGIMVVLYSSLWFSYAVPLGYKSFFEAPLTNLQQIGIPAGILGLRLSAVTMRMTRSTMLEVLRQDYIRTAWAKGLAERSVVVGHALRNAILPVVTIIGNQLPLVIGGTVILEALFGLPGMGQLTLQSVNQRDYTQLQGIVLLMAAVIVFFNLLVDITYGILDPRIRYT